MNIRKILEKIDYEVVSGNQETTEVSGLQYDSRKLNSGELFVCIKGMRVDGHDFAESVYEKGCRAFLCEHKLDLPPDAFQAVTKDTRLALAYAAAAFYDYPGDKLKLIGVTGTKGKTTTSVLLQEILEKNGKKCGYIGSNGFILNKKHVDIGSTTPESLELQKYLAAMVFEGATHGVIEVSSQALDYDRVKCLTFETCVFTNLSPDHIGKSEHSSYEAYRDAKKKLFRDYGCKNFVCNLDDHESEYMMKGLDCKIITYSIKDKAADFYGSDYAPFRDEKTLGISFNCTHENVYTPVKMQTPGEFSALNGLAAIAAAYCQGVSTKDSIRVIATTAVDGRFEIIQGLLGSTFVVDFAHNDISLTNALTALRQYNPTRLICVFGSVGGRTQVRRKGLGQAASALADYSIITSDSPDFEPPEQICAEIVSYYDKSKPYEVIIDRTEAIRRAVEMAGEGDIVLFAGKGNETYQLVNGVKLPFEESKVVKEMSKQVAEERKKKNA